MTIARIWHGRTNAAEADTYLEFLKARAIPDYQETKGNLGVTIMRRIDGEAAHFLILTLWESAEAIRRFAGDDIERAKYYPEDASFLLEFEPTVTHYQVEAEVWRGVPG